VANSIGVAAPWAIPGFVRHIFVLLVVSGPGIRMLRNMCSFVFTALDV